MPNGASKPALAIQSIYSQAWINSQLHYRTTTIGPPSWYDFFQVLEFCFPRNLCVSNDFSDLVSGKACGIPNVCVSSDRDSLSLSLSVSILIRGICLFLNGIGERI